MGIETIALLAISGLKAYSTVKTAKNKSKMIAHNAEIKANRRSKDVRLKMARARSSFLNSGIEMSDTPLNSIQEMGTIGLEDIENIRTTATSRIKNIMSSARMTAFTELAGTAFTAFGGGTAGTGKAIPSAEYTSFNTGEYAKLMGKGTAGTSMDLSSGVYGSRGALFNSSNTFTTNFGTGDSFGEVKF